MRMEKGQVRNCADTHFQNYHRILKQARWSSLAAGHVLLNLLDENIYALSHKCLFPQRRTSAAACGVSWGGWTSPREDWPHESGERAAQNGSAETIGRC